MFSGKVVDLTFTPLLHCMNIKVAAQQWLSINTCADLRQKLLFAQTTNVIILFVPLYCFFVFLSRFHVCVQTLPFGQTVAKNPHYFLQMIWDMAEYANHLIRLSNKGNNISPLYMHLKERQKSRKAVTSRSKHAHLSSDCSLFFSRPDSRHWGSERHCAVRSSGAAVLPLLPACSIAASTSLQGSATTPAQKCVSPASMQQHHGRMIWVDVVTVMCMMWNV